MSHMGIEISDEPFTKKRMQQLVDHAWESWCSEFVYGEPPKPYTKVFSTICANKEEAEAEARKILNRGCVNTMIFVPYYKASHAKIKDKQRQLEETENKKEKLKRETNFTNHKSQFITCKTCNSKLNRDYYWAKISKCPVCNSDMHTNTYLERMQGYDEKINRLKKEISQLEKEASKTDKRNVKMYAIGDFAGC